MGPQSLSSRCASSDTPSAIGAFLINSSWLSGQCVQGSSRKMCVSWSNFEIFMLTFSWLTWFSSCRLFVSVLDAFQNDMRYGFKLLTFHADQDAKGFRLSISRDETRAKSTSSKAHSAAASGHGAEFVNVAKILFKWCHCLLCRKKL